MYVYIKKYKEAALSSIDSIEHYIKKNFNEMDFENATSREYMQFQIDEMLKEIKAARRLIETKKFYSLL